MKVLFFHGGPGLNGNPERVLLTEPFARHGLELVVWDEPSKQRPEGAPFREADAYDAAIESARAFLDAEASDAPAVLIGHSFGAWAVWELARARPERVARVIYVIPDLSPPDDHANVFALLRDDYLRHGEAENAQRMSAILEAYTGAFDEHARAGWAMAAESPRLFEVYWHDRAEMERYAACYAGPYALDVEGFFAVSATRPPLPEGRSEVPAQLVWGEHDRIVARDVARRLVGERHESVEEIVIPGCAHYPHVEQTSAFLEFCFPERWDGG